MGSAALIWSLAFLAVELLERGPAIRAFWQDWAVAAALIVPALVLGRFLAAPAAAELALPLAGQAAASVLAFPACAWTVGWIDRRRNYG